MSNTTAWEEYCEASLDLSNQDDVGEARAIADLQAQLDEQAAPTKAQGMPWA